MGTCGLRMRLGAVAICGIGAIACCATFFGQAMGEDGASKKSARARAAAYAVNHQILTGKRVADLPYEQVEWVMEVGGWAGKDFDFVDLWLRGCPTFQAMLEEGNLELRAGFAPYPREEWENRVKKKIQACEKITSLRSKAMTEFVRLLDAAALEGIPDLLLSESREEADSVAVLNGILEEDKKVEVGK